MINPGVGYTVTTEADGSQSLQIDGAGSPGGGASAPSQNYEQFQIIVSGNTLRVVGGTVLWAPHYFNDNDRPDQPLCANQNYISSFTRYTGDTVVIGTEPSSIMMSENGKVILGT
jgi:hypothetical protein